MLRPRPLNNVPPADQARLPLAWLGANCHVPMFPGGRTAMRLGTRLAIGVGAMLIVGFGGPPAEAQVPAGTISVDETGQFLPNGQATISGSYSCEEGSGFAFITGNLCSRSADWRRSGASSSSRRFAPASPRAGPPWCGEPASTRVGVPSHLRASWCAPTSPASPWPRPPRTSACGGDPAFPYGFGVRGWSWTIPSGCGADAGSAAQSVRSPVIAAAGHGNRFGGGQTRRCPA